MDFLDCHGEGEDFEVDIPLGWEYGGGRKEEWRKEECEDKKINRANFSFIFQFIHLRGISTGWAWDFNRVFFG